MKNVGLICEHLLADFASINLDEMSAIRLMNRVDTKFITTVPQLYKLLKQTKELYRVQETEGIRNLPYHTLYYDSPWRDMFLAHHNGKKNRRKIRIRTYLQTNTSFLEVKHKDNHGRTAKTRLSLPSAVIDNLTLYKPFLDLWQPYDVESLQKQLENKFNRITLVNQKMTERLTIDSSLAFHNLQNNHCCEMDNLVIIELKRDGRYPSPIRKILRQLYISPSSFSKYCMGMILTDNTLKQNRFKEQLYHLKKLCS